MSPALRFAPFLLAALGRLAPAQEALVVRPPPPALDDFESDADQDGVPDGWYNLRDGSLTQGGPVGPTLLRFQADRPSRPARISRGFGLDGSSIEAIQLSLWVRGKDLQPGERIGEEPGLLIDFLDENLISTARGRLGPFTRRDGEAWVLHRKRIAVPPNTRDAILTVGLLGGTGTLEIDALRVETIPRGGSITTDLVVNGDFELGDAKPAYWIVEANARRAHPGLDSDSALSLSGSGARALMPLGIPVQGAAAIELTYSAAADGLRASGGAQAGVFFLDRRGRTLPGSRRAARFLGSFPWRDERAILDIPPDAARAVVQFEMTDSRGTLLIDNVRAAVRTSAGSPFLTWTPFHEGDDTSRWAPYVHADAIEPGSALDASALLDAPAGQHGGVRSVGGQLRFEDGTPARFFGVTLLPPLAFAEPAAADRLADRLARSGVNLVRLGDLDAPLGLGVSLLDDARDDTTHLDPAALANLDHLIAALIERGIYFAVELQGQARFREADGLPDLRLLPPGGGPALGFDPALRDRFLTIAHAFLDHVNPETNRAYRDEPALAWLTFAGESSLFDQLDPDKALPPSWAPRLRAEVTAARAAAGRSGWQKLESAQWRTIAADLRDAGFKAPLAASSHWRREPEYVSTLTAPGLDLVDDRIFWAPSRSTDPARRSLLFEGPESPIRQPANRKRRDGTPYALGQFAAFTEDAWALPFEGADLLFVTALARHDGWDALVRRGVATHPIAWGAAATGTGGGPDVYATAEALNANPQVFHILPFASALLLEPREATNRRGPNQIPGWDDDAGTLRIDRPTVQGFAGWPAGDSIDFSAWRLRLDNTYATAFLASRDGQPIERSNRLVLTVISRVQPTGFAWVDASRTAVADPGQPPLLLEPISGSFEWLGGGGLTVRALDPAGRPTVAATVESTGGTPRFPLNTPRGTLHWELIIDR